MASYIFSSYTKLFWLTLTLIALLVPQRANAQTIEPLEPEYETLHQLLSLHYDPQFVRQICAEITYYQPYLELSQWSGFYAMYRCQNEMLEEGLFNLYATSEIDFIETGSEDCLQIERHSAPCLRIWKGLSPYAHHQRWLTQFYFDNRTIIATVDVSNETGEVRDVDVVDIVNIDAGDTLQTDIDLNADGVNDFILQRYHRGYSTALLDVFAYIFDDFRYIRQPRIFVRDIHKDTFNVVTENQQVVVNVVENLSDRHGCKWQRERDYNFVPHQTLFQHKYLQEPHVAECFLAKASRAQDSIEQKALLAQALSADITTDIINREDFRTFIQQELAFWHASHGNFNTALHLLRQITHSGDESASYTSAITTTISKSDSFWETCKALHHLEGERELVYVLDTFYGRDGFLSTGQPQWSTICPLQQFTQVALEILPIQIDETPQNYIARLGISATSWQSFQLDADNAKEWVTILSPDTPIVAMFDETESGWQIHYATLTAGTANDIHLIEQDNMLYLEVEASIRLNKLHWTRRKCNAESIGALTPTDSCVYSDFPEAGAFYIMMEDLITNTVLEQSGDYFASFEEYIENTKYVTRAEDQPSNDHWEDTSLSGAEAYKLAFSYEVNGNTQVALLYYQMVALAYPNSDYGSLAELRLPKQIIRFR